MLKYTRHLISSPTISRLINNKTTLIRFQRFHYHKYQQYSYKRYTAFCGFALTGLIACVGIQQLRAEEAGETELESDVYSVRNNPIRELLKDGKSIRDLEIVLYQYQVCPFCCKVRAFFKFYGIPFKIVEVDPMLKSELKFSTYKKVPVVVIDGKVQLNDSSHIITCISDILREESGTYLSPELAESERKWRRWVDHKFVHTLPVNIYRTYEEAMEAFEYISDMNKFSWWQRLSAKYGGAAAMFAVSKKLKQKYNITNEREALYECGREWMEELNGKPFHGGETPDLADLAVYGILTSIEGLRSFNDLLANTPIGPWYGRVKQHVEQVKL